MVGQSGTGKTSVADLIFNIYTPEQGEILIDNVSTLSYRNKHTQPKIAIVSQEPALFNRTVIDNIKYNHDCEFQDVEEASKLSDAYSYIEEGNFGIAELNQEDIQREG